MGREWSEPQKEIFAHMKHNRALAVVARAGSGKTTTIEQCVQGAPEGNRVLLCAFNRDIRDELKTRVKGADVKTLNQMGYGALSRLWGIPMKVDEDRQRKLVRNVVPKELSNDHRTSVLKMVQMAMAQVVEDDDSLRTIMDRYDIYTEGLEDDFYVRWTQEVLRLTREKSATISFDDQVYIPAYFKAQMPRYDNVFVDEAQDLTIAQKILVALSLHRNGKIVFVGDPNQAIYGFRGADTDSIGNMIDFFEADVIPLSITYRCPKQVVRLAKLVVPDFEASPRALEGHVALCSEEEMLRGCQAGDYVVSRFNGPLVRGCLSLLAEGKRAKVRGRDIGAGLIALIRKSAARTLTDFRKWVEAWVKAESERLMEEDQERRIEEVLDKAEALTSLSLSVDTIHDLLWKIEDLFTDSTEEAVIFSSVHKAKGLEADRVWMFEQTFRVGRSEEEDNLFYVAVTRAKKELMLIQTPRRDGKQDPSLWTQLNEESDE